MDASSAQVLSAGIAEKVKGQLLAPGMILVLENADASTVRDYLHILPDAPVLVTSTQTAISSLASSTASHFQLSDEANDVASKVLTCIREALFPGQRVVTLVANGGTGKTQVVLKFVSRESFR